MNNIRFFKILYDPKNFVAFTHNSNGKKLETVFLIAILQYDWIDEKDVYLVTDGHRVPSKYVGCSLMPDDYKMYSIFRCSYHYDKPCDDMEAYWFFKVGFREFSTESINFKVIDGI